MRNRKTAGAILAAAVVLMMGFATEVLAFRMIQNTGVGRFSSGALVQCDAAGGFVHWNNANIPFSHNTANQGSGKGTALANAAAAWTGVSGANHNVTIAGTTNAGFVTDGTNTLLWANGNGCTGSCLAITALVLASGQVITETDVSFNNSVTWTTNGSNYDTEAVAAHELGHCMGIHHTNVNKPQNRPTMYATYFGSAGRTLETDDRQALQCAQNRYPPSGAQLASFADARGVDAALAMEGVALATSQRPGLAVMRFSLPEAMEVSLQVFDVAGRHLATLMSGTRGAGEHEVAWDGGTRLGDASPGVYFARLVTPVTTARATVLLTD